jgi:hypothetical protein
MCARFKCLPGQLYREDVGLLQLLAMEGMVGDE